MADSCECSDWTQVGHPASAYWPDLHPNYHHPDCPKYTPPTPVDRLTVPHVPRALGDVAEKIAEEDSWPRHRYRARQPEDLTKDELIALVKRMMLQRRPHEKDSLTVWEAVSHLRSLADTIPMLKVVIDYLEPPITEENGERGVWQRCLMCEKRFFYTRGLKSYDLCIGCSKDAGRYQVSLGWGEQAAFMQYTPRDMTLYARPAARAAIANHFRHLADYLEKKP